MKPAVPGLHGLWCAIYSKKCLCWSLDSICTDDFKLLKKRALEGSNIFLDETKVPWNLNKPFVFLFG